MAEIPLFNCAALREAKFESWSQNRDPCVVFGQGKRGKNSVTFLLTSDFSYI